MIKDVKAPVGGFREWDAITSWATAIADELKEAASAPGTESEKAHPTPSRFENSLARSPSATSVPSSGPSRVSRRLAHSG